MSEDHQFRIHPMVFRQILTSLELDPSEIIEISIEGAERSSDRRHLRDALKDVEGLKTSGYEAKSIDVPIVLTVAGSTGSIIQGIDVLLKWWTIQRAKKDSVKLEIRTQQGGKLDLSAKTVEEARNLLHDTAGMIEAGPKRKTLPSQP